ncbi:MAG: Mrp/NBP35 family ATP-binding protein [Pirellulales bacterium]
MADSSVSQAAVEAAIREFPDPETGRALGPLEQVRSVRLDGSKLHVAIGLTSWASLVWQETQERLADRLRAQFPQLTDLVIDVVEHKRPPQKLGEIGLTAKSVIAVGSGKGGVGKSTIAASLALGLKRAGAAVGLMDADVYGPSVPHLLGVNQRPAVVDGKIEPIEAAGLKVMSMGFLVPPGEAVVWRGPMLHGAIMQFLRDTLWGDLDYLIIDMPPGTGDIALTLSQILPLTGAVIVCTPQDVALLDAVKAIAMFRKVSIPILGMVENMSYFQCPGCNNRYDIFGSGGAQRKAAELDVPFLGEVPINLQIRIHGDQGRTAGNYDDPAAAPYLEGICQRLVTSLVAARREKPPMPSLPTLG